MPFRAGGDADPRSEFEGGGVMPNTVFPKGTDALTASDKLRLQSITGQEVDSRAPRDPYFWQGGVRPQPPAKKPTEEELLRDPGRYRESPPA
jgi:hypothetical protein